MGTTTCRGCTGKLPPKLEKQMDKNMENDIEIGFMSGFVAIIFRIMVLPVCGSL